MKSCRGCRNLVSPMGKGFAVCKAMDGTLNTQERYPDGVTRTRYGLRPSIVAMRAPGAECGPDATLWRPTWWWSLTGRKAPEDL